MDHPGAHLNFEFAVGISSIPAAPGHSQRILHTRVGPCDQWNRADTIVRHSLPRLGSKEADISILVAPCSVTFLLLGHHVL